MPKTSEKLARLGANGLSISRAAAGPWLAHELHKRPPEERDWALAGVVAGLTVSDMVDGRLGRYAGESKNGAWLDQMSDKAFALPPMIVLANNGEISPIHWKAKLGRDIGVTALRSAVHLNGGSTAAEQLGKMKAVAEMTGLVISASPLSESHPELANRVFEASTTLNVASGAQYMQAFGSFLLASARGEHQEEHAHHIDMLTS